MANRNALRFETIAARRITDAGKLKIYFRRFEAMARYILFAGRTCYAEGGAHDLRSTGDNLNDACAWGRKLLEPGIDRQEWWHVYDNAAGRIVAGSARQAHDVASLVPSDRCKVDL
jgi:hypothetical protein